MASNATSLGEPEARLDPHELPQLFAARGFALNATLEEMLAEHFSHRTERRGCGFTQATRHLAVLVNQPRSASQNAIAALFPEWARAHGGNAPALPLQTSLRALLESVLGLRAQFEAFKPDLVLYQAGADVHIDDPFGGLLTTAQMRERDRLVFSLTRSLGIPLTFNLAGGYQIEKDGSIPRVVELHLNTFEEALRAWQLL